MAFRLALVFQHGKNLVSAAERRTILNRESSTQLRISDLWAVVPAITGKIELVYEGEQEGSMIVAQNMISLAIKSQFLHHFPDPEKIKKEKQTNPYQKVLDWFGAGNSIELSNEAGEKEYMRVLNSVDGLASLVKATDPNLKGSDQFLMMEFVLHGLAGFSMISRMHITSGLKFEDMFGSVFSLEDDFEDEGYEEDDSI